MVHQNINTMKKVLFSILSLGILCLSAFTSSSQTADFIAVGGNDHYATTPLWNCNDLINLYSRYNGGTHNWTLPSGCIFGSGTTASSPDITVVLSPRALGSYTITHSVTVSGTTYTSSQTFDLLNYVTGNTVTAPATTTFSGPSDPAVITGTLITGATYQWYKKGLYDVAYAAIAGATGYDYDPPVLSDSTYFYRVATINYNQGCNCSNYSQSNIVLIKITTPSPCVCAGSNSITGTMGSYDQGGSSINITIINGSVPVMSSRFFTFQWQKKSATTGNVYVDISGATGQNYDPPVASETTCYRRKVIGAGSCISYSNELCYAIGDNPDKVINETSPVHDKMQPENPLLKQGATFLNNPYPNPANGDITVSCSIENRQNGTIRVTDIQGRLIIEKTISGESKVILPKEYFATGMYNCILIVNDQVMDTKKFSFIKQ
jgi:hypothetical protein